MVPFDWYAFGPSWVHLFHADGCWLFGLRPQFEARIPQVPVPTVWMDRYRHSFGFNAGMAHDSQPLLRIDLVYPPCVLNHFKRYLRLFGWVLFWKASAHFPISKENLVRLHRGCNLDIVVFFDRNFLLMLVIFIASIDSRTNLQSTRTYNHPLFIPRVFKPFRLNLLRFLCVIHSILNHKAPSACLDSIAFREHHWAVWRFFRFGLEKSY